MKYLISMQYLHGLTPVGAVKTDGVETKILFYKLPSSNRSITDAYEVVD